MRVVAVLVLTFVAVECMPSLSVGGQDLTQGVDPEIPTGVNGKDNAKMDVGVDQEKGVTVTKEQTTHTENQEEQEENESHADDHNENYGDSTHSVNQTSSTHKKHSKDETRDEKEKQSLNLGQGGLTMTKDTKTVDEKNEAYENSGQTTYQESDTGPNSNRTYESGSEYSNSNSTRDKKTKETHQQFGLGTDGSSDFQKKESTSEQHEDQKDASGSSFHKQEEVTRTDNGIQKTGSGSGSSYAESEANSSQTNTENVEEKHSDGDQTQSSDGDEKQNSDGDEKQNSGGDEKQKSNGDENQNSGGDEKQNSIDGSNDVGVNNGRRHRRHHIHEGVNKYLDYNEKRLILKSDVKKPKILDDPELIPKLRQDYLLAIAKKIHNTKIIGTDNGRAKVVSKHHIGDSTESQMRNYDSSHLESHYRSLAQKFGYSPVSSHYANAQFIEKKYANLPSPFGYKPGKLQYGSSNTQNGAEKYGTGKTKHYVEDLQLSPVEWEERARKNYEKVNAQLHNGRKTGFNSHAKRIHTINPAVREAIFSKKIEDLLHPTKASEDLSPFHLFRFNGGNKKVTAVPKDNTITNNITTGAVTGPGSKNKLNGRGRFNKLNDKDIRPKDSIDAKDKSNSPYVTSDVDVNSRRENENIATKNFLYGSTEINHGVATNRIDKEGSHQAPNTDYTERSTVDENSGNASPRVSYDTTEGSTNNVDSVSSSHSSDTSTKFENNKESTKGTPGYETSGDFYDVPKSTSDKTDSVGFNYDSETQFHSKHTDENIVDINNARYETTDMTTRKSVDGYVGLNDTEVKYKNTDSTIVNEDFSSEDTRSNVFDSSNTAKQENNSSSTDISTTNSNFIVDTNNSTNVDKTVINVDESVTEDSLNINSNDVNETNIGLVADIDSNIEDSYLKYSSDVDNFENKTLPTTTPTMVTSTQAINKEESDSNDALKFDQNDELISVSSVNRDDDSGSTVASQAMYEGDLEKDLVVSTDSSVDNFNSEYSTSVDKPDNKTISEGDTSTSTPQTFTTDNNNDVTNSSNVGNYSSVTGFKNDGDFNVDNSPTEYSTSLDRPSNETITEPDVSQAVTKDNFDVNVTYTSVYGDDLNAVNNTNDVTTRSGSAMDSTEISTIASVVDETIEKTNSATSTSQTITKEESNKSVETSFDVTVKSDDTSNSPSTDSTVNSLNSEPETTTKLEVTSQDHSSSGLTAVTDKSVTENIGDTNKSTSLSDSALTYNSTESSDASTKSLSDSNKAYVNDSTFDTTVIGIGNTSSETTTTVGINNRFYGSDTPANPAMLDSSITSATESISTTGIDITEASGGLTKATSGTLDTSSYSTDTSVAPATLNLNNSANESTFDSTLSVTTEGSVDSTSTTSSGSFDNSFDSVSLIAPENPNINTEGGFGSESFDSVSDVTKSSIVSTDVTTTSESDRNSFSSDASVTPETPSLRTGGDFPDSSDNGVTETSRKTTNLSPSDSDSSSFRPDVSAPVTSDSDVYNTDSSFNSTATDSASTPTILTDTNTRVDINSEEKTTNLPSKSTTTLRSTDADITSDSDISTPNDRLTDSTVTTESNTNADISDTPAITNANIEDSETATASEVSNTSVDIKSGSAEHPTTPIATPVSSTNSEATSSTRTDNSGISGGAAVAPADAAPVSITEGNLDKTSERIRAMGDNDNVTKSITKSEGRKEYAAETAESKSDENASRSLSAEPSLFNSEIDSVNTDDFGSTSIETTLR